MELADVVRNKKRGRAIPFDRRTACLQGLWGRLSSMRRRAVVLWALRGAEISVSELEAYFPGDPCFLEALSAARAWAEGRVKMPAARRAILAAHAAAKETSDARAAALCHAVGQACSAVHTPRHAPGLVCYRLTALLSGLPEADWERAIEGELALFLRLADAAEAEADMPRPWAPFLQD